jgi:hypothetical protein
MFVPSENCHSCKSVIGKAMHLMIARTNRTASRANSGVIDASHLNLSLPRRQYFLSASYQRATRLHRSQAQSFSSLSLRITSDDICSKGLLVCTPWTGVYHTPYCGCDKQGYTSCRRVAWSDVPSKKERLDRGCFASSPETDTKHYLFKSDKEKVPPNYTSVTTYTKMVLLHLPVSGAQARPHALIGTCGWTPLAQPCAREDRIKPYQQPRLHREPRSGTFKRADRPLPVLPYLLNPMHEP